MVVNTSTSCVGLYLLLLYLLFKFTGDIRSSGMFRSVDWWLFGNVSGQPIGPVFRVQTVQEEDKRLLQRR
jgi:hypothetical protein